MDLIRRFVYWLGFRPEFGSIFHSPSRAIQLATRDAFRNMSFKPPIVLSDETQMRVEPTYESLRRENEELRSNYANLLSQRTANTVSHCNRKTDYKMIVHIFNPDGCVHCNELCNIMREMDRVINE